MQHGDRHRRLFLGWFECRKCVLPLLMAYLTGLSPKADCFMSSLKDPPPPSLTGRLLVLFCLQSGCITWTLLLLEGGGREGRGGCYSSRLCCPCCVLMSSGVSLPGRSLLAVPESAFTLATWLPLICLPVHPGERLRPSETMPAPRLESDVTPNCSPRLRYIYLSFFGVRTELRNRFPQDSESRPL